MIIEPGPLAGYAWICACGAASQGAYASRSRARRNARRHYANGCTAAGEAFGVVDLSDEQQRLLWRAQRRQQLERTARGTIAHYLRGLYPGSPEARAMGCPCPEGVPVAPDGLNLTVRASCPVHGAWLRVGGPAA